MKMAKTVHHLVVSLFFSFFHLDYSSFLFLLLFIIALLPFFLFCFFHFSNRLTYQGQTGDQLSLSFEPSPGNPDEPRAMTLLATVPFSSHRKRMSVVVKDAQGQHWLYLKGADNVVFDRTSESNGYDLVGGRAKIMAQLEVRQSTRKANDAMKCKFLCCAIIISMIISIAATCLLLMRLLYFKSTTQFSVFEGCFACVLFFSLHLPFFVSLFSAPFQGICGRRVAHVGARLPPSECQRSFGLVRGMEACNRGHFRPQWRARESSSHH